MRFNFISLVAAAGALCFAAAPSFADNPGKHPAYLHALSDLRDARAHLEHLSSDPIDHAEEHAIENIDKAIGEIKRAAIDDGKDIHDHVALDVPGDHPGRLHKAAELLRRVHSDVDREEDDPAARGLKHRAIEHIDVALRETEAAIRDVERHR